jgi:hypothetical protein
MSDDVPSSDRRGDLIALIEAAERALAAEPNDGNSAAAADIRALMARVEDATPGGAPLHAQIDATRKWLGLLEQPADHERFGGTAHIRDYVITQLRLTRGAVEDYLRETR